jgi:hypothetical protein
MNSRPKNWEFSFSSLPLKTQGNNMLLTMLVILFISIIFLMKNPVLNKWVACYVFNFRNELIQAKGDISSPDGGVIHTGGELAMVGDNITCMSTNSYTAHHKLKLSIFITHQQRN